MPGKIAVPHHSIVDWDFERDGTYRSLDSTYFISSPTSLKLGPPPGGWIDTILCRIPDTLCLPQGELRTWLRATTAYQYPAVFRNQAPLGTSNMLNGYLIYLTLTELMLGRYIDGAGSVPDVCSGESLLNTWCHFRVFYYNGLTPGEEEALCVDVYKEEAEEWVKIGTTLYDTDNMWKDSDINRSGFRSSLVAGVITWWDDTEIWGPV